MSTKLLWALPLSHFMADITDEHIKEAFSVACEATLKEDSQDLDSVARNLELPDNDTLEALRAALDYMLVLDSPREGWGVFHPSCEIGGKVYPVPLSRGGSWFPIWARAFSSAPYAYIQARFADLLWEAKYGGRKKYKWGQRAVDAYLQALEEPFGVDVDLVEGACRALDLAKHLSDKQRRSLAITALRDSVREEIENPEIVPGVSIRSLEKLVDLPRGLHPEDLEDLIDDVLQHKLPSYARIECLGLKLRLAETDEEQLALREAQVMVQADEGRSRGGLAKYMHFQEAIQLAEKYGRKDLVNELQQEVEPLSEDSLQRIETEYEIPTAEIETYIGYFVGEDDIGSALRRFGGKIPSGDPTQNKALARERMNEFPLRSLVTNLMLGDQGELIKKTQAPEGLEAHEVISNETRSIRLFAGVAVHILQAINDRYGAIGADASVFQSELIDKAQAEWLALAVGHYEAGDYRSSVSVMAPRLENAIRGFAQDVGIVILRDSQGGKKVGGVKDLAGLLAELHGRMPEANRRYWRTLLVESLGLNLRDRVAHGLIEDPTAEDAAILIHVACQLLIPMSEGQQNGQR